MISDYDLVLVAKAAYDPKAIPIFEGIRQSIRIFQSKINDLNIIAIEGTHNPIGWALDFCALKATDHEASDHPSLGFLHAGFYAASLLAMPTIKQAIGSDPFAICGHSLGAAQALLIGGLLIDDGKLPVSIGAFAPPRVGGDQFVNIVKPFSKAYRYGDDPVPLVPVWTKQYPYLQVPLIEIGEFRFDVFSSHHIDNYVNSVPK